MRDGGGYRARLHAGIRLMPVMRSEPIREVTLVHGGGREVTTWSWSSSPRAPTRQTYRAIATPVICEATRPCSASAPGHRGSRTRWNRLMLNACADRSGYFMPPRARSWRGQQQVGERVPVRGAASRAARGSGRSAVPSRLIAHTTTGVRLSSRPNPARTAAASSLPIDGTERPSACAWADQRRDGLPSVIQRMDCGLPSPSAVRAATRTRARPPGPGSLPGAGAESWSWAWSPRRVTR